MMDFLRETVRNLVVLVLFVTLAQMLLPDNDLRKYTRVILGLLVIVAVLNPLLQLIQMDLERELNLGWTGSGGVVVGTVGSGPGIGAGSGNGSRPGLSADPTPWLERGRALAARGQERATVGARKRLESQVASLVRLAPGVGEVQAAVQWDAGGDLQTVDLVVYLDERRNRAEISVAETEERIIRLVTDFFGVSPGQLRVRLVDAGLQREDGDRG